MLGAGIEFTCPAGKDLARLSNSLAYAMLTKVLTAIASFTGHFG
jgi:hypothetical protein